MSVPIEKKVPVLPKRSGKLPGTVKYPWRDMEVGDSFLFPEGTRGSIGGRMAYAHRILPGSRFVSRKDDDDRVRCWRIK